MLRHKERMRRGTQGTKARSPTQPLGMCKFVPDSANVKIAGKFKVAATYAPIKHTCPNTCALKGEGCYAQQSYVGMLNKKLEIEHEGKTPEELAYVEAAAIDAAFPKGIPQDGARGGRDLRIHVSGDCQTETAARVVAAAARRYMARGGGQVWSYTHAWRVVPRSAWEGVSVLASVESAVDAAEAVALGYTPAIVVPTHKDMRVYELDGQKFIPCPAQTRDMSCVDCRLCFNDTKLQSRSQGIAFAAHGTKTNSLKKQLTVVS